MFFPLDIITLSSTKILLGYRKRALRLRYDYYLSNNKCNWPVLPENNVGRPAGISVISLSSFSIIYLNTHLKVTLDYSHFLARYTLSNLNRSLLYGLSCKRDTISLSPLSSPTPLPVTSAILSINLGDPS